MCRKINLIYIVSNGRSGSTLLDMILGAQDGFFSMGELQMLAMEIKHEKQNCSCGEKVPRCPFWSKVIKDTKDAIAGTDYFRKGWSGKVLRWRELREVLFDSLSDERYETIKQYGRDNAEVMYAVRDLLDEEGREIDYLVDASKDPYRLYWLYRSGYFNIKIIHIIKHPQGFVYSMTKEKRGLERASRAIRMSLRWVIENILIEYVAKKACRGSQYIKIDYEILAASPDETLRSLNRYMDHQGKEKVEIMSAGHAISGNSMRFGSKKIRLDEKWREKQPRAIKGLVLLLTSPFLYLMKR